MTALILNSGMGKRMGGLTKDKPKCMTQISGKTILSRQLCQLLNAGVKNVVITTGEFDEAIKDHCADIDLSLNYTFVQNLLYAKTNYIYSMYLAREFLDDDIILIHGDIVFEDSILDLAITNAESCVVVCSGVPLPEKDFKAIVVNGKVVKIGVEFFDQAVTSQPLYKFLREDFKVWMERITSFCENGKTGCYAENALNEITGKINLFPLDVKSSMCLEIDTPHDLECVLSALSNGDYND